jgi:hypothetical protein
LPAGRYKLVVGVYEPEANLRLLLTSGQDQVILQEIQLP